MDAATPDGPHDALFARAWSWRRLRVALAAIAVPIAIQLPGWEAAYWILPTRWVFVALVLLAVFALFEHWPSRLPRRAARWVVQVVAVALAVPVTVAIAYAVTTLGLDPPWYRTPSRIEGFAFMTVVGLLVAPWIATTALLRQIRGEAERQALGFALERSRLERSALDARLRLLQAQVEPHFLFNTLANVRELVESGSPQAARVLASLIAYLRAAVPRLDAASATVGEELDQVRAYLEVMHLRMPDRLAFEIDADAVARRHECLATSILTLVENAVRHGIDPAEQGGRIVVRVAVEGRSVRARVTDSGVGLAATGTSHGSGLANLRERLRIAYGDAATLQLTAATPRGTVAEFVYPAREVTA